MISLNERCKMVALLKSLKYIYVPIFRITPEDGFWNVNPKY